MEGNSNIPKGGNWKIRRMFMFLITIFCVAVISYCLWAELDTEVAETAVLMAFLTIIANVGCYVFGAAWEDINISKIGG